MQAFLVLQSTCWMVVCIQLPLLSVGSSLMLERLLILHACLQSIGFLLVNNQLPLCGIGESPMLEHSSIVPKPVQLLQLLVLVLVEVSELVALERELVPELVSFLLAEFLVVL
jgi:hypothetical protein